MGIFTGRGRYHHSTPTPGMREAHAREMSIERASAEFINNAAHGYVIPGCLRAAAQMEMADRLADGPVHVEYLAERIGADERMLHRMLRLLATTGIVKEVEPGVFVLMELGSALRTDSPMSVRDAVLAVTTHPVYSAGGDLIHPLLTGRPAIDHIFHQPFFEYLGSHPVEGEEFHTGMGAYSLAASRQFAMECPLPQTGVLVDVGGGQGALLNEVLSRHRGLHGVLFDRPRVVQNHRLRFDDSRWTVVGGDFFDADSIPKADRFVLQFVLHNWGDDECVTILQNCRRALAKGGSVLVHEMLVPPGNDPHPAKVMDVIMMSLLEGACERTEEEFRELMDKAGFRAVRVVPPRTGALSIIEATI